MFELQLLFISKIPLLYDLQDERYAQGRGFITKAVNGCHTSSLTTPEDKEQAQQIHVSPTSNANDYEMKCGEKKEGGKRLEREQAETEGSQIF